MSKIRPFRGLRPLKELAAEIAALPYDVLDEAETRAEIAKHPLSFLRVSSAEATLPEGTKDNSPETYARAAANLQEYIDKGQLVQDEKPCYYIYRQQMGANIQIGLVGACSVEEYRQGLIKKHELTRPDKEEGRVNHILATKAQTGPIFLTYRNKREIDALILKIISNTTPEYDFVSDDGIRHTLYVIDHVLAVQQLAKAFSEVPCLYIADGHHRCAAAARAAEELAKGHKETGNEEYNYFLAVVFPDNMLHIMDYNRVVKDLNGLSLDEFKAALEQNFDIAPCEKKNPRPVKSHSFGMYLDHAWYTLTAKEGSFDDKDPIGALDVSILQEKVLGPVLGITDPRRDKRISFVGGIRGLKALEEKVEEEGFALAFAMYPTSMDELLKVADAGLIMPPKSTWFEPKLRDAMVIHLIEEEITK